MDRNQPLILEMASRLGRDSLIYTFVTTAVFPLALVNTAILTRFLTTSRFGQLAIVFFWSGMLTVILNLLILRGTERHIWGSSEDLMDTADAQTAVTSVMRRALGTGLLMNLLIVGLAAFSVYVYSRPLARILLHDPSLQTAIVWGGISGALGSFWRLSTGILRWERRRTAFSVVYVGRWVVAIAVAWVLLLNGFGISGVLAATTIGTAATALAALWLARRSFSLRFHVESARHIISKDIPLLAMVIGLSILHDADVFLLSIVAKSSQVGVYRLATRLTSIVSYAVSAFLLAWSPLEGSSLFRATYQETGRERVRGLFVLYYLMAGTGIVVLLSVTAKPLIAVVAPSYGAAVTFVPITAIAYLSYGLLIVVARASDFPRRYLTYGVSTVVGAATMIATCLALARPLGGYGVALGDLGGAIVGLVVIITVAGAFRKLPPIDIRRFAGVLLSGAVSYWVGYQLADKVGPWRSVLEIAGLALYPTLLVVTHTIPRDHLRQLFSAARLALRGNHIAEDLIRRIAELPSPQQRVLLLVLRDRQGAGNAARMTGMPLYALKAEAANAMRMLTGTATDSQLDEAIGGLLLTSHSVTLSGELERRLQKAGVPWSELHALTSAFKTLKAAPRKAWSATFGSVGANLPPPPWPIDADVLDLLGRRVRDREPPELLAAMRGISDRELDRRLVGALRALAGLPDRPPAATLIASFLFDRPASVAARQLWAAGIDPIELHEIELVLRGIRSMPLSGWEAILASARPPRGLLESGKSRALESVPELVVG